MPRVGWDKMLYSAVQSQKVVTVYFRYKRLLCLGFAAMAVFIILIDNMDDVGAETVGGVVM